MILWSSLKLVGFYFFSCPYRFVRTFDVGTVSHYEHANNTKDNTPNSNINIELSVGVKKSPGSVPRVIKFDNDLKPIGVLLTLGEVIIK
jgi:hypothetical protein